MPTEVGLSASATGPLADYLNLHLEEGAGGAFTDCSTFTPARTLFDGSLTAYARDHPDAQRAQTVFTATTTRSTRAFRFTVSLRDAPAGQTLRAESTFSCTSRPAPDPASLQHADRVNGERTGGELVASPQHALQVQPGRAAKA